MNSARRFFTVGFVSSLALYGLGLISARETFIFLVMGILLYRSARRAFKSNEGKQTFFSLTQNSGDFIAISGTDRKLRYLNPAGKALVGLDVNANAVGMDARSFYSAADNLKLDNEAIPAVLATGSWSGELNYKNILTGEMIPMSMYVFSLYHDVTKEQIGLAAVGRDLRESRARERRLDRFFELSLDMLGIADTQGYFVRMNPAFTEILGYTEAELCSRPSTDFIHPDDIARTMEQIERQAHGHSVMSFENRYRTKSGEYRWLSWKSIPDGNLTFGVARDITEEKRQAFIMEKLSVDAIAASHAKSEFLANMSHEIRTPLNGVIGMTTLLMDSHLSEEQKGYAENVRSSAESLLTIINDILDFSKIEAGKLDIEHLDFSLESLIDETTKTMLWATKNKSLNFTVNCPRNSDHLFRGDPGRIRQILTNLLTNAIKFTPAGSIHLEVRAVDSKTDATKYRFAITDTGIGLSEEARSKLFQAFSQADASTSRKFGGTGLGLSISRRLAELMEGEIGVESQEGQGSTFWFTLTLPHSAQPLAQKKKSLNPLKTQFPGAHILVAEDNMVNQMILLAMLRKLGFKPQAVASGLEVLAILKEKSFDLILMDCHMPELDGYGATGIIRQSDICPEIPIIALTANALIGDKEKCLAAGMNDYASKPVNIEILAAVMEKWLEVGANRKLAA